MIDYHYWILFIVVLAVNVGATFTSYAWDKPWFGRMRTNTNTSSDENDDAHSPDDEQSRYQWKKLLPQFLAVYLLATFSDWMQGPYVYALYAEYGYPQRDIATLFVAGFASSMIFGSFIGSMADWGGRRAFVILFAIIYASSCLTKRKSYVYAAHLSFRYVNRTDVFFLLANKDVKQYFVLMIGRILGGIATSLLFSVFDAWLIRCHYDSGIEHMIGQTFAWSSYSNSVIAIVAGLVANTAVSHGSHLTEIGSGVYRGGYLIPFDVSFCALVACGVAAYVFWDENYGERDTNVPSVHFGGLKEAYHTAIDNRKILLCGLISSLFEGSMYIFVFFWTPIIVEHEESWTVPFGLIFSIFMVSCMAGSSFFSILSRIYRVEDIAAAIFAISSVSVLAVALAKNAWSSLSAMCVFEVMVGAYWPSIGTMKGRYVPEEERAAVYNLYRIPLNLIVNSVLLTDFSPRTAFFIMCGMLLTACGLQIWICTIPECDHEFLAVDQNERWEGEDCSASAIETAPGIFNKPSAEPSVQEGENISRTELL